MGWVLRSNNSKGFPVILDIPDTNNNQLKKSVEFEAPTGGGSQWFERFYCFQTPNRKYPYLLGWLVVPFNCKIQLEKGIK